MAINTRADGVYVEGDTVRVPMKNPPAPQSRFDYKRGQRPSDRPAWGEVIFAQDGFVRVRLTVYSKRSSRYWNETFTAALLDETAARFAATMKGTH